MDTINKKQLTHWLKSEFTVDKIDKQQFIHLLESEFLKTKGAIVAERLDWLDYCLFIFTENYKELQSYSSSTKKPDVASAMINDRDYSSIVHGQLVRHLHNFLTASKSLVEHTRSSMRSWYKGTQLLKQYEEKVSDDFSNDPLTSFIESLRNYCTHKSPIGIITYHHSGNEETSNLSCIHKESITNWKNLSSSARKYVDKYDHDIPLMEPISEYKTKVVNFRIWLKEEFKRFHSRDIYESKWYIQAVNLAKEGNYDEILRSGGINIPFKY